MRKVIFERYDNGRGYLAKIKDKEIGAIWHNDMRGFTVMLQGTTKTAQADTIEEARRKLVQGYRELAKEQKHKRQMERNE